MTLLAIRFIVVEMAKVCKKTQIEYIFYPRKINEIRSNNILGVFA
jgi:hypothetical protein